MSISNLTIGFFTSVIASALARGRRMRNLLLAASALIVGSGAAIAIGFLAYLCWRVTARPWEKRAEARVD